MLIESLLSRGAWIEIWIGRYTNAVTQLSLLSRGAWIEMVLFALLFNADKVAPLTRSVDWNAFRKGVEQFHCVAPLTRSVDWNSIIITLTDFGLCRSSHEERGLKSEIKPIYEDEIGSLLSRGAWIEILSGCSLRPRPTSLLSRGAWIEILGICKTIKPYAVAPLTRSVDWNISRICSIDISHCRSSHEERGLKWEPMHLLLAHVWSLLSRGAWIEMEYRTELKYWLLLLLSRGAWIKALFIIMCIKRLTLCILYLKNNAII